MPAKKQRTKVEGGRVFQFFYGAAPMLIGSAFDAGVTAPLVVWYNAQQQYGLSTIEAAKMIQKERGFMGFFKGAEGIIMTKMIQRTFKSTGLGFVVPMVKEQFPDRSPVFRGALAGTMAACLVEVPSKQPVELARLLANDVRSPYNSFGAIGALWKFGGIKGLFGPAIVPSLFVSGIWTCVFYGGREYCKTLEPESTPGKYTLRFFQGFGLGALAGGLSTPPEMIRARLAKDLNNQFAEVNAGKRKPQDIQFIVGGIPKVLAQIAAENADKPWYLRYSPLVGGLGVKLVRAGVGGFALNFGMTITENALESWAQSQ